MRGIKITAVAPNGEIWDFQVNPNSTKDNLLTDLVQSLSLDSSVTYEFRGNPSFPLSDGDILVIDKGFSKSILGSPSKRGR